MYRSRTDEFLRRRKAYRKQRLDSLGSDDHDRANLLRLEEGHVADNRTTLPPEWVDDVEEAQRTMEDIKKKMKELTAMHSKHINSPDFDKHMEEEHKIEILTSEITSLFHKCQKTIAAIGRKGGAPDSSKQDKTMTKNIQQSLAMALQEQSGFFRKSQSNYLSKMRGRSEQQKGFEMDFGEEEELDAESLAFEKGFSDAQQAQLKANTQRITQRENEITQIVNSITELSQIFKDLATLVIDQGSILDRIDYNIEMAATHVEEGHKQLVQGEKYQKKASKKIYCILVLVVILVIFFVLVVVKKNA